MKACKTVLGIVVAAALIVILGAAHSYAEAPPHPKGIILLIGDGMGVNQIRSAAIYAKEVLDKTLVMDSFVTRGAMTTSSANAEITDSAAAATALYSGYKVNNGAINILPDGRKLSSIGHAAKKAGMSVGVLSTTRLTHATPAALFSRSDHRNKENFIADQLPQFAPDVAMAGGLRHFIPRDKNGSKRKDARDIVKEMTKDGYAFVTNKAELDAVDASSTQKLLGLFALSHMAYELDRQNDHDLASQPSLADMTRVALDILGRNPKGFFVMIEGGRIDHACHAHDIKGSIYDTIAFDDAVRVALEYRQSHPQVLVLVTADHETGGLGLGTGTEYALDMAALNPIKHSTEYLQRRIKKQPDKADDILKAAGFELTVEERTLLTRNLPGAKPSSVPELSGHGHKLDKYVLSWVQFALGYIESTRAKVGWTAFVHTAQPVITFAVGPGEEEFRGALDNTDIARKMARLLGLTLEEPASETNRQSQHVLWDAAVMATLLEGHEQFTSRVP